MSRVDRNVAGLDCQLLSGVSVLDFLDYSPRQGLSVVRVADVLVDFDYWLGCKSVASSLADQVKLHNKIHQLTGGYTAPLIGFNPWKAIVEGDDYLGFIKKTLAMDAFKGIKIYPTLGFGPDGTIVKSIDRDRHFCTPDNISDRDAEEKVKSALSTIYDYCEQQGHIVMAHSSHSSGISKNAIAIASPGHWENVLRDHVNLKVNLGHLGSIKAADNRNWTQEFLTLMVNKGYNNVRGDIGYWYERDEIQAFVSLLADMKIKNPEVVNKVMYGSDWFMISREAGWGGYIQRTYNAFNANQSITEQDRRRIFFDNAASFFGGIDESCRQTESLVLKYS